MDILITEKTLRKFLDTNASLETVTEALCESGPTVDRVHKLENDNLLEIEVITNRIDCASVFGVAREANTILTQKNIKSRLLHDPYKTAPLVNHQTQKINLKIENKDFAKRFLCLAIDGVSITDSDQETKDLLTVVEQRPINNIVDITNVTTLLFGMPSHVFDKDKLSLQQLILRESKEGESITLLDDTSLKLQPGDLIIEDGNKNLVDLCGIIGGKYAQVDNHTKNILLIVPVYNPQKIRKTSLYHQKRTLAAQIFEKKPDSNLAPHILNLLAKEIMKVAGGHLSSAILDINNQNTNKKSIELNIDWLAKFVGQEISAEDVIKILNNLDFTCQTNNRTLQVSVPEFRVDDIDNKEDLAEEITRIYGYQNITPKFPSLITSVTAASSIFNLEKKIRNTLSALQYNEVINISLISKKQIEDCGLDTANHLALKNALSEDLSIMRTSLVPNTLQNHKNNKGISKTDLCFFEIGNTYLQTSNKKIVEEPNLLFSNNSSLLKLKNDLNSLFNLLNLTNQISLRTANTYPKYFNIENTIEIVCGDIALGYIGEINQTTTFNFNLDKSVFVCEINLNNLNNIKPKTSYQPISSFPDILEDINIVSTLPLGEIYSTIKNASGLINKIDYLNSYQNKHTFRIYFGSMERNLTQEETAQIKQQILQKFS